MAKSITPGSKVHVKVVKTPTSAAAEKTIVRLFYKDRSVKREQERQRKVRKSGFRQSPRGGRLWNVNMVVQKPVEARIGVTKTITATLHVLQDLKSVSRFVEVTPA